MTIVTKSDKLIIPGDFNLHIDNLQNAGEVKFLKIIYSFLFWFNKSRYTLDLVLTRDILELSLSWRIHF